MTYRNHKFMEIKKPESIHKSKNKSNSLIVNVEKVLISKFLLNDGATLLLAVSGGVDSVVLLDVIYEISKKRFYNISIAHYNHSLRGKSSDKDEEFASNIAENYNLNFFSAKGKVSDYAKINSMSIEEAARHLRYNFLIRTAQKVGAQYIVTAHTADDCVETFLMNLFRGTGLTGLSGIQPIRRIKKNVMIIRPLLDIKKSELINYATNEKLEWREDESNLITDYTRNKIRLEILPKLANEITPSVVDNINRAADLIMQADEFIGQYVSNIFDEVITTKSTDVIHINISILSSYSKFIQGEIIHKILEIYFQIPLVTMKIIDRILSLINSKTGAYIEFSNQIKILRDRNSLIVFRQKQKVKIFDTIKKEGKFKAGNLKIILKEVDKKNVMFSKNPAIEYFDYDLIPAKLILRNWESGDRFQPLGMTGTIKVSDFLINKKVPKNEKDSVLLLTSKTDVIWICGFRINDKFKITKTTKRFLKAELKTNK